MLVINDVAMFLILELVLPYFFHHDTHYVMGKPYHLVDNGEFLVV